jgi:hypothetical protein
MRVNLNKKLSFLFSETVRRSYMGSPLVLRPLVLRPLVLRPLVLRPLVLRPLVLRPSRFFHIKKYFIFLYERNSHLGL